MGSGLDPARRAPRRLGDSDSPRIPAGPALGRLRTRDSEVAGSFGEPRPTPEE